MKHLLLRELKLAVAEGGSTSRSLMFFLVILGIAPLALGPAPELLERMGGGLVWVVALLSMLLSLDRLFQPDLEDGSLAIFLTNHRSRHGGMLGGNLEDDMAFVPPYGLWDVVVCKVLAHWLVTGLPMALMAPLLGLWYGLSPEALGITAVSLLVGTPALTFIGAIGAGLLAGVQRGGLLVTIIVMPLYVPILIFGSSAVEAASTQGNPWPLIQILAGLSVVAGVLGPWAATAALRIHLD